MSDTLTRDRAGVVDLGQFKHERIKARAEAVKAHSATLRRPDFGSGMLQAMRRRAAAEPDSAAVARWTRAIASIYAAYKRWDAVYGERRA